MDKRLKDLDKAFEASLSFGFNDKEANYIQILIDMKESLKTLK
jgi:hypothetical protein